MRRFSRIGRTAARFLLRVVEPAILVAGGPLLISALLLIASVDASTAKVPPPKERVQFVLVSFDSTPIRGDLEKHPLHKLLMRVREARPEGYTGEDPTFTVFINSAFLELHPRWRPRGKRRKPWAELDESTWKPHRAPRGTTLHHQIGFAKTPKQIEERAERMRAWIDLGVEVGSHGVGHLDGTDWTLRQWRREMTHHRAVLTRLELPLPSGYRAPFLATGKMGRASLRDPAFRAMHDQGFRYDTSKILVSGPRWPRLVPRTEIWEFPLITVRVDGERVLLFGDYGEMSSRQHTKVVMRAFRQRYRGGRAPLLFGSHGEQIRSIERVMKKVCYLPDVRCGTFSEAVEYLDKNPGLNGRRGRR